MKLLGFVKCRTYMCQIFKYPMSQAFIFSSIYYLQYRFRWFTYLFSFIKIILKQIRHHNTAWWRHQMETFFALLALCAGNPPVPVNSPHKGQWLGALMFSLICARINGWVNNRDAGDLRRNRSHYDVIVMRPSSVDEKLICNVVVPLYIKGNTINVYFFKITHGLLS